MSSEEEQNQTSSNYPDWFQKWLDEFMQAAGMDQLPEYKSAYYPDWYKQAYPLMSSYGRNLWWTSALPSPFPIFMPAYAWSALGRVASSEYYWAQGNRYVAPENLLGQVSAAYYREQTAASPYLALYSASKALSYAAPGAGIFRGFAFAPMGFAANAATAYAEAPYIRQLVGAVGASTAYQALQGRGTAYPFQEPTAAEMYSATMEWTAGQTSFLLARSFASGIWAGIKGGGLLSAAQNAYLGILTREGLSLASPAGATTVLGIEGAVGANLRVGQGIGGILRSGWAGMGGWGGVASGVGFGLMQLGAQLTAQELAYIYAMGQAGLGSQLYGTPQLAQQGLERWGLAIGSWEIGVGLASYAGIMAGSAALGPALAGGGIALAGAAALGLQITADITARYEGGIPWNEPITYIRSRREGGEFQVNPRLQGPSLGLGPNQPTAEEYKTWFYNRGGVYANYAYMTQNYVQVPVQAPTTYPMGRYGPASTYTGGMTWQSQWTATPDYRQAVPSDVAAYYQGQTAQLWTLYGQRGVVGGAFRYSRSSQVYSQLDALYSKARTEGLNLQEQAQLSRLRVEAKVHHAAVTDIWNQYSTLTDQINALRGFTPREVTETGLPGRMGPQLLNDQPLLYAEPAYSGGPSAPIVTITPAGTYSRYGPQIAGENIGYTPSASAVAWQAAVSTAARLYTLTGLAYGDYNTVLYGGTGMFGTLAEAQSRQAYLAGTDTSPMGLWLARNTFQITGAPGDYNVRLTRDLSTLGSDSLVAYARSQVQGATRAEDLNLSLGWIEAQYKAGRINTVTYLNAKSNLQGYAGYTARAGEGIYTISSATGESSLTDWAMGSDVNASIRAEMGAGRSTADIRADLVSAGMSKDLADYLTGMAMGGVYIGGNRVMGAHGRRTYYRPHTLAENQAYFLSTMQARNYLYTPGYEAWAKELGYAELPKSPQGRYGVWRPGYASSWDRWTFERGAYAITAAPPSIEEMSSTMDAAMISHEVMWLAENGDLANMIGAEFYRIGRETQ